MSKIEEITEIEDTSPTLNVNMDTVSTNDNVIDLYSIGHEETEELHTMGVEMPFKHTLQIKGEQGEVVWISALFDGCAMVAAMCCLSVFEKVKHKLGKWRQLWKRLRMADGTIVPSKAVWKGIMQLEDVKIEGEFEVFDSGGGWAFLLGKPLLHKFRANHDFHTDTVVIRKYSGTEASVLGNENTEPRLSNDVTPNQEPETKIIFNVLRQDDGNILPIYLTTEESDADANSILTRDTQLWKPEHVA